jgi:peptidoglycan/LPS O-acetylase OafA/YrhL
MCATLATCAIFNLADACLIPLLALMLYFVAGDSNGLLSRLLASRFACYWGRVSYSLYMTHAVSSMVLVRFMPLSAFEGRALMIRLGVCGLYFGTVAAMAMLVYHAIEEPARRRMRRIFSKCECQHCLAANGRIVTWPPSALSR